MGKGAVQTRGRAAAGSRVADAVQLSLSVISHSGQASPIPSRTSATATAAASDETPGGGSSRAMAKARSRACGSARSASNHDPRIRGWPRRPAAPRWPIRAVSGSPAAVPSSSASRSLLPGRSIRPPGGSGRLAQSRDSLLQGLWLVHVFRLPVQNAKRQARESQRTPRRRLGRSHPDAIGGIRASRSAMPWTRRRPTCSAMSSFGPSRLRSKQESERRSGDDRERERFSLVFCS